MNEKFEKNKSFILNNYKNKNKPNCDLGDIQELVNVILNKVQLNKPSQLGTKRTPHGGQHFWIVYGGF